MLLVRPACYCKRFRTVSLARFRVCRKERFLWANAVVTQRTTETGFPGGKATSQEKPAAPTRCSPLLVPLNPILKTSSKHRGACRCLTIQLASQSNLQRASMPIWPAESWDRADRHSSGRNLHWLNGDTTRWVGLNYFRAALPSTLETWSR